MLWPQVWRLLLERGGDAALADGDGETAAALAPTAWGALGPAQLAC